jgi:hypothetical protein
MQKILQGCWMSAGFPSSTFSDLKLLLSLYLSCTTQKSNPFGYLQFLVQGHEGPLLYFLESLRFLLLIRSLQTEEILK